MTQTDSNGEPHLLGVFRGYADTAMRFGDGDECPDGVRRNVSVDMRCGARALALRDVSEPSMCAYRLTLDVPIDCALIHDRRPAQRPEADAAQALPPQTSDQRDARLDARGCDETTLARALTCERDLATLKEANLAQS